MSKAKLRVAIQETLEEFRENILAKCCQLIDTQGFIIASSPIYEGNQKLAINCLKSYIVSSDILKSLKLGGFSLSLVSSEQWNLLLKVIKLESEEAILCSLFKKDIPLGLAFNSINECSEKILSILQPNSVIQKKEILNEIIDDKEKLSELTKIQDIVKKLQQDPIYKSIVDDEANQPNEDK
ncbi:MAG: hypothetical protein QXX95_03655 [Nitrososphaerales archaeon]